MPKTVTVWRQKCRGGLARPRPEVGARTLPGNPYITHIQSGALKQDANLTQYILANLKYIHAGHCAPEQRGVFAPTVGSGATTTGYGGFTQLAGTLNYHLVRQLALGEIIKNTVLGNSSGVSKLKKNFVGPTIYYD